VSDVVDALSADLAVAPERLDVLRRFSPPEQRVIADAVAQARQAQTVELDNALRRALRFVPRVLRGRAAKLLFPGGEHGLSPGGEHGLSPGGEHA
jgi:hypothetical protein